MPQRKPRYTGSAGKTPDYKTVLDALNLSHGWDVQDVAQVLSEVLRDQINVKSFVEIANAAALQGSWFMISRRFCSPKP